MTKTLAATLLALVLATSPCLAQTEPIRPDSRVVGLPLYSSDGVHIGHITALGTYSGENTLIGDVSSAMGFGTRRVLIPFAMATAQADRVVLTVSNDEVADILFPEREP
jgi:hypothetical protein